MPAPPTVPQCITASTDASEYRQVGTDRLLLERFAKERDQQAFALLVSRYHDLVMGVCRRVLGNAADAEEAYQATFLVLARKARSQNWQDVVAGWLHQTAYRTALKLRKLRGRRKTREHEAAQRRQSSTNASPETAATLQELATVLDEELARLPANYREPLTLQLLQGLSRAEIADRLGLAVGAVKDRLEQARELLRRRLTARGITLAATALAGWMVTSSASASAPTAMAQTTAQAAAAFAIGQGVSGIVPASTVSLAQGVLKMMFYTKLKIFGAIFASLTALTAAALAMIVDTPDRFEKGLRGRIEFIQTGGASPCITVLLDEFNTSLNLDLAKDVKVALAFQNGHAGNLAPGMYVGLRLASDHRTVQEIHALGKTHEVTISAVPGARQLVADSNDDEEEKSTKSARFELAAGAIIRIGGLPAGFEHLRPGMKARLEMGRVSELVNYVEVEPDQVAIFSGAIVELDKTGRGIKVRTEGEDDAEVETWYRLAEGAILILDGKPAGLNDLQVGAGIDCRLVPGSQVSVEALVAKTPAPDEEDVGIPEDQGKAEMADAAKE